jgi:hypothetical protein
MHEISHRHVYKGGIDRDNTYPLLLINTYSACQPFPAFSLLLPLVYQLHLVLLPARHQGSGHAARGSGPKLTKGLE